MDPHQTALQYKPQLEAKGYTVDAQGNVRYPQNGIPGHAQDINPPWVWAQALDTAPMSWKLPGSDPSSAWHDLYQDGGPFTNRSSWDSSTGTYDASTDWGTLLGTAAVGSLFAAPALGAAFGGGGGAAAGAGSAAPSAAGSGGAMTAAGGVLDGLPGAMATLPPAAGAASSVPAWVGPVLKATAPLGVSLATRPQTAGQNGLSGTGLPPELLAQLQQLIQLSMQRQQETAPVHQAAMLLAQKLAANQNNLPSLAPARNATQGAGPAPTMNPNVTAALARLMGR